MNKSRIFLIWGLLLAVTHVMGYTITVNPIEIQAGQSTNLVINLSNTETNLTAYQLSLYLPEGVTVQKNTDGKYSFTRNDYRHVGDFTISVKDAVDGSILITCYSLEKDVLTGNSGELICLPIDVAPTASTSLQGSIKNIEFTDIYANAHNISDVNFNITVVKPVATLVTAPTAKTLTYTGAAQQLVYAGVASGGTMQYSLNGTTYGNNIPTGTNAGNYTVYYKVVGDQSHSDTAPETVSVTISKATASITTVPTAKTLTYTGAAQQLVNAGKASGGTMQYSLDGTNYGNNIPTETNAGSYTVYYKVEGDANHNDTDPATVSVTINKAAASVTTAPTAKTLTYTGTAQQLVNPGNASGGTMHYSLNGTTYDTSIPTETNIGSYTVYYKVVGDENHNDTDPATVSVTINKAAASVIMAPTAKTLTYTGSVQELVNAGKASGGTMQYSLDGTTYDASIPTGTNAGSYTVYYKVEGDESHSDTNPATVSVTINAKNASDLTVSDIDALTYTGLAQTPAVTVKDGTTPLTSGTDYSVSYSNNTNAGTATVTITGMGNYSGTKTANFTIETVPLTITAKSYTIKQGEALPTFEAEYAGFKNSETASVLTTQPAISTAATSASAPGTYEIIVSGASATNYDITYVKGTLTIVEADAITLTAKSYTIKYGDTLPDFGFTSEGAALDGTPSITCEATSVSPVGTYPIVITKGSVTNYNAHYVNGTLTIEKAPLTISAGTYTMKQGDNLPAFTPTYTGFKNGETEEVLTTKPTLTTTATSASAPGKYEVTVSGAEAANYEITYEPGTLTIGEADAITLTAQSYTIKYGDALPEFEFTSEGAALDGTPSITCEATSASPVGTYPIVITKGSVTNYNDHYVNGTLTIEKAPLTINAGTYTMKQGDNLPAFTPTYTGFKNGETEEVLTTKPTLTTEATSASEPGDYEVTVSGAEAANYEITYEPGTLTIAEADPITVIVKNASREYGDENPAFEYEIRGGTEEQLGGTLELTCEAVATSAVGDYAIKAAKGTATYPNIVFVDGTLTIEKAPLTISGGSYTMKQAEALPTFTPTYTGFKNGETEEVLTTKPTLTTEATSASEPGDYEVTVSGAEAANYEITYEPGTLTIVEADPITVIVKNASREYGDENPDFEYEISGGTEEQLGGALELTCEAVATSAVGEYAIKAAKGTATYPNIVFVDGTLTIEKAPLTISGGTYTIKQGENLPAFTAIYSGFKNGETEEVLTTKPTLTTKATSASEPGEYEVTVSGAESQNYEITYEAGTLTITEVSGIQTYFNENDNVNDSWYTIDGRKQQGKPTQKGVYIRNGVKVVIK